MGTTLEDAAKNAAVNALTNVVGTFIDAKTLVERQTKINSAIVETVKNISKDVKSYSQGSISYFEVLDSEQANGIYRVTARVDVVVEDFKAYIRKSAIAQQDISVGLFANMYSEKDQLKEKYNLLIDNIIEPLATAQVYNIELSDPVPFKDSTLYQIEGFRTSVVKERDSIAFTMTIRLNPDFKENMVKTLENISDHKTKATPSSCLGERTIGYTYCHHYDHYQLCNDCFRLSVFNNKLRTTDIYHLKDVIDYGGELTQTSQTWSKENPYLWTLGGRGMCHSYSIEQGQKPLAHLVINFLDSSNNTIKFVEIQNTRRGVIENWAEPGVGTMVLSAKESNILGVRSKNDKILFSTGNSGHLLTRQKDPISTCRSNDNSQHFSHVAVMDELTFWVVLEMDESTLRNAKSFDVEYIQP